MRCITHAIRHRRAGSCRSNQHTRTVGKRYAGCKRNIHAIAKRHTGCRGKHAYCLSQRNTCPNCDVNRDAQPVGGLAG